MTGSPLRRSGLVPARCHRRSILPTLALAALAVALSVQSAAAGRVWCRTDPVVVIDGVLVDIWISSTTDAFLVATGPTRIDVTVPVGTSTATIISDVGFGHGYDIRFLESRALRRTANLLQVWVAVYVPASDRTLPIRVDFAPRIVGILAPASAEGTANSWVRLRSSV